MLSHAVPLLPHYIFVTQCLALIHTQEQQPQKKTVCISTIRISRCVEKRKSEQIVNYYFEKKIFYNYNKYVEETLILSSIWPLAAWISILPRKVEWFIIPKVDRPFQLDSPELNLFMEPRTGKWNKFHLLDKSRFHTSKNYHWLRKYDFRSTHDDKVCKLLHV